MPDDAHSAEVHFELVNIDDLAEDDWDDEVREAVAAAEADAKAGRLVPHAEVMEWFSRIGTPDATPMPRKWQRK